MTQQRLLILGGSHAEIPLILAGQRLGFHVTTTGNAPTDLGHKFADAYVEADFSNPLQVRKVAEQIYATAICSGCNDFAAITAAIVSEELDLPGHDSADITKTIHHKNLFYEVAIRANIPVPRSKEVMSVVEAREVITDFGFPVILKPTDLTGGKGISIIECEDELERAWEKAISLSRQDCLIIQQYIVGSNHAASALIICGQVTFTFFDNEHYYANKYLVGGASFPTILSMNIQIRIRSSIQQLVHELHLTDGLLHLQFLVDRVDNYFIIDVCRRAPGDLYIRFAELCTGIPYPELIVRAEAGLPMSLAELAIPDHYLGRLCLIPQEMGRFLGVEELDGPGKILERLPLVLPGIEVTNTGQQKVEILQIQFGSMSEMHSVMNEPEKRFRVKSL
jgi:biotin carboxylase